MTAKEFLAALSRQSREAIALTGRQRDPCAQGDSILIVMPIVGREDAEADYKNVRTALADFRHKGSLVPVTECQFSAGDVACSLPLTPERVSFRCLALATSSVEGLKDVLKEALWPIQSYDKALSIPVTVQQSSTALLALIDKSSCAEALTGISSLIRHRSLDHHCILSLPRMPKPKEIKTHSFDHGGGHFYRYRLHQTKLQGRAERLGRLATFLLGLDRDCPNHFFKTGPRISATEWEIFPEAQEDRRSPLPGLAHRAIDQKRFKGAHDNVEVLCIEEDADTVAAEIPIWWEREEMGEYGSCFDPAGPLTGHIDLLRICDEIVEIWDYKPDAEVATTAGMQVFLYALAMAVRTGIPLTQFRCGFFDTHAAWAFAPATTLFERTRSGPRKT